MSATVTRTPITVEFYAGNLFCGLTEDQLAREMLVIRARAARVRARLGIPEPPPRPLLTFGASDPE